MLGSWDWFAFDFGVMFWGHFSLGHFYVYIPVYGVYSFSPL